MSVDDAKATTEDVVVVVVDHPDVAAGGAEPATKSMMSLFAKCRALRRGQAVSAVLVYLIATLLTTTIGVYTQRHPQFANHGKGVSGGQLMMLHLCFAFMLSGFLTCCWPGFCGPRGSGVTQARELAEFSAYLVLMTFLDRTEVVTRDTITHRTPTFYKLMILLFAISLCTISSISTKYQRPSSGTESATRIDTTSAKKESEVALLNRAQTDEWRGWMQFAFFLFHYFNAFHVSREIRTMVNSFVWMTGYGNFHYYRKTGNFSFERFCQTLWRLNMLAICICPLAQIPFGRLYFCLLITTFWFIIYGTMYVYYKSRYNTYVLATEFTVLFVFAYCVWDAPFSDRLFPLVWRPFFLLTSPFFGNADYSYYSFTGWSYEHHYTWITGMLSAAGYDYFNGLFLRMDALPTKRKVAVKMSVFLLCMGILVGYYAVTNPMSNETYRAIYPAITNILILLYVVLRNLSATLRRRQLRLLVFLGKFSLEMYIVQWYVALPTAGNGRIGFGALSWTGRRSQWADFGISVALLIFVAHRALALTERIREIVLPSKTPTRLRCGNILFVGILCGFTYCVQFLLLKAFT